VIPIVVLGSPVLSSRESGGSKDASGFNANIVDVIIGICVFTCF
jgi:hypothetical protein